MTTIRTTWLATIVLAVTFLASGSAGQTLLYPGDLVFLGYQTDDPDAFAFMLLTDIRAGTEIKFTDNGWNGNLEAFNTSEGTTRWTADTDLPRGSIIRYDHVPGGDPLATGGGAFADTLQGLSIIGDQIIAYQGEDLDPSFIAGVSSNDRWVTEGPDPTYSYSFIPPTLELGLHIRGFQSEIDNGYYDQTRTDQGALTAGTPSEFRWSINDSSLTWARTSTGSGFAFPAWSVTLNPEPAILLHHDVHAHDFGVAVINEFSDALAMEVEAYDLTGDLTVTAPAGFQVSLASGSGFGSSLSLTPVGGTVGPVDVYIRFAPTAAQAYTDVITFAAAGAWTREYLVSGLGAKAFGLAQALPSNGGTGALAGSDVFDKGLSGQILRLGMIGVADGAISDLTVTLPAGWTGLNAGAVSFLGSAFTGAGAAVSGQVLTVTGAALTDLATGSIVIGGLTTPSLTDPAEDGAAAVTVAVAESGGGLVSLVNQPVVYVCVPVANIRDYDPATYLPLDLDDYVAVSGVATVDAGVFSLTSLQVYIQDETAGIYVNKISQVPAVVRGHRYIVKGQVGHFAGNFRVVPDDATLDLFDMGTAVVPDPMVLTVAQIAADAESFEGSLVKVQNVSILSGSWGPDASLEISDDGGVSVVDLRVDADTDVDEMTPPAGTFSVTGILYQYDSTEPHNRGYRVLPRSSADFGGVSATPGPPARISLQPCFPNPFNPNTMLRFTLPARIQVNLDVFDLRGRKVRTLVNEVREAGIHDVRFDGTADDGRPLASGTYFARLQAGSVVHVDKLALAK